MFVELMVKRKKHFARLRAEEQRKKPPTKAQKRSMDIDLVKKSSKKVEMVQESSSKRAGKIIKEGNMGHFQIIRADGMIKMLQSIDREDLETLWKLVKAKHENTMPEEGYEIVLWVSVTQPSVKDKGKGIMQEPERPLTKKDQVAIDEDLARNIQAQLDAEIIEEERLERQKQEEANIALIKSWENT
ncbi:hypothetical protein Tco_0344693 [Tanacetum coccineum]